MLPKLPKLGPSGNPLNSVRQAIREGRERIHKAGEGIRSVGDDLRGFATPTTETPPSAPESQNKPPSVESLTSAVTDEETVAYQKRELGKELLLLEKHLSQGCRIPPITGEPCDCCSPKHTITIEALALETYGITGKPIYQEIARWAKEIEEKTTIPEIESGRHNYGDDAVEARAYRKNILGSESLGALLSPEE